ncbi:MAG: ribbon-helix-helix domain-containing protein [Angustibacter sp.]
MKVSISLPLEDIEFLDTYAHEQRRPSRSAAVHDAIAVLRSARLQSDYAAAFDEWAQSGDAQAWEATAADGLGAR